MRRGSRDNVLAGMLVLASIGAALTVVIILAGGIESLKRKTYAVKFPFAVGVSGLDPGSDVQLAGVSIGKVSAVRLPDSTESAEQFVVVRFGVDRRHTLYQDADIELVQELLGGSARLNITSIGSAASGELDKDHPPEAAMGGGLLGKIGLGEGGAQDLQGLIQSWREFGEEAKGVATRFNTTWDQNGQVWVEHITSILEFAREDLPGKIDVVVEQFQKGGQFFTDAQGLLSENKATISASIASYRDLGARLNDITQRNEERIDRIFAQVDGATADADTIGDQVRAFMGRFDGGADDPLVRVRTRAEAALDEFTTLGQQWNAVAMENRADLRRAIARFRLTADQALDTMLEVRRSPWRLLHRPDERETAYELLYDAARQYARAIADLDSVSTTIASLRDQQSSGEAAIVDDAWVAELTTQIDASRRAYEDAEDRFLDALLGVSGGE